MTHEVIISKRTRKVWVNSDVDGSSIGRFCARTGMDVHRTGTEQMAGLGECLHCTHGPATRDDWLTFIAKMHEHYGVVIKHDALDIA